MKDHDSNAADPLDPADPVNRDSVSDSWGRAAAYDAYADGLHTYALGGLRHHEAASSAVYCAFVAADHHVAHLGDAEMLRPWLYAITRHYCRAGKLPRLRLSASPASAPVPKDAAMAELERTLLAAELASLDWPDTDGLSAAHREVLELSVRHGMESRAVGMMLGKPAAESFEVLSQAWHELERSLAAVALLRTSRGHCPDLAALAEGWSGRLTAQRREPLVAHVDACSRCQYHLHKVLGAPQAPSILPHVPAPKELRERVLGDLLDAGPEKAAEKTAIAGRLTAFDAFGFPVIATMRVPAARSQPRTAAPMPVERRSRRLGALLAGRVSSAAAEAVAGEVASAPGRLRTPAAASPDVKTPANTMDEGSGLDAAAVNAGTERRRWLRRASEGLDDGPIAPRRELAAGAETEHTASAAFAAASPADAPDAQPVAQSVVQSVVQPVARSAAQSAEVLAVLRTETAAAGDTGNLTEQLAASFGPAPTRAAASTAVRDSASEDTLITHRVGRRAGVFEDVRPVRQNPASAPGPAPRNSVAAAIEGRRRGADDVRRGVAPVGDAYEAAATVAAAVAAGDPAGAQVPPIAPVGVVPTAVMPVGMVPGRAGRTPRDSPRTFARSLTVAESRKRKPGVKSALASSAVLSGVGAAGVTAFVLFVPSAPAGNKTLFTPPEAGGNGQQTPDYPRPTSSPDAGPALPVAGSVHSGGLPGNDTVTAQVVAAVLPTTPSTPSSSMPSVGGDLPVNGPIGPVPTQTGTTASPDPSGNGQLHLSVSQRSNNPGDVAVTLWNSGTSPVSWTASPDAPWLSLSATSGMLAGGAQTSIHVLVDSSAEPNGAWTAHVRFDPGSQMISISGNGGSGGGSPSGGPTSSPTTPSGTPSSTPSTPGSPVSTPSTPHSSTPSGSSASSATTGSASGPSSQSSPSSPSTSSSSSSPSTSGSSGSPSNGPISQPTGSGSASQPSATNTPATNTRATSPTRTRPH